jgi:Holliday junction resolvasome RuvABC endonuclease subunit
VQGGSSFVLLSIAGVLMEAAQEAFPGAVVLDMPTQSWKRDSVGHGNASKAEVLEHAHGLGLIGNDQDVADALAMAQAGFESWARRTESAAA